MRVLKDVFSYYTQTKKITPADFFYFFPNGIWVILSYGTIKNKIGGKPTFGGPKLRQGDIRFAK